MNTPLTVGLVQQSCTEDRNANLNASLAGVREAAARGAELVLLQELHTGVYFCQNEDVKRFDQAETIPGPTTETLAALAKELGIVIVGSVFERRAPGMYHNTAVVFERDGSIAGQYRKMHIPDDPGFHEKFISRPATRASRRSQPRLACSAYWCAGTSGTPEAARLMAMHGANLLLYPTAIGWDPKDDDGEKTRQRDAWMTIQRAHAVANGLPVLVCNRIGLEPDPRGRTPGIQFWGSSFIAGPQGEIVAEAPTDRTTVLVAEVDRARSETVRRIWPFFRDRRIDAYQDLLKRYGK